MPKPEVAFSNTIQDAQLGDATAFAELYEAFGRRVYGLCRKLLGSDEAAADATQEVFMRVRQKLHTFDVSKSFAPWVLGVTSNYCCDVLRRRKREQRIFANTSYDPGELRSGEGSPLAAVTTAAEREQVLAAIELLPERYRVATVLRYYGDHTYDEIAAHLGIERNTVATMLFRARKQLRQRLAATKEERP